MASETGKLQSRIVWTVERVDYLYDFFRDRERGDHKLHITYLEELVEHVKYIIEFNDRVSKSKPAKES